MAETPTLDPQITTETVLKFAQDGLAGAEKEHQKTADTENISYYSGEIHAYEQIIALLT